MLAKQLQAAAGNAAEPVYVDDVFSTYTYVGTSSAQRIENGIALGNSAVDGTVLHLTGDSLADSAPIPNSLTFSNVTVNTSTKKYGTGSLYFNGTDSTVYMQNPASVDLGTGDFTIETWMYMTAAPSSQYIRVLWVSDGGYTFVFSDYTQELIFGGQGFSISTSKVKNDFLNQWVHLAAERVGSTITVYFNGTSIGSTTYSGKVGVGSQNYMVIGGTYPVDSGYPFTGYMDDFRITYGSSRYKGAFTPPTAALPLDTLSDTGKGGMVWIKDRTTDYNHNIMDSARGFTTGKKLGTNGTWAQGNTTELADWAGYISSGNTNGFTISKSGSGAIDWANMNQSGESYVSWTFRKQPKFFDVVTYTGNGSSGRAVPHNLGSTPGCFIVKRTDTTSNWGVYHRSTGNGAIGYLNSTIAFYTSVSDFSYTDPTSTTFTVNVDYNQNGGTYVAYLFAHNAGGFGSTGTDNAISCGGFTTDGSGNYDLNLGYEPQWLMVKAVNGSDPYYGSWRMVDTQRYWASYPNNPDYLRANSAGSEVLSSTGTNLLRPYPNSRGIYFSNLYSDSAYIYVAIRRPHKPPTSGTEVFKPIASTASTGTQLATGFPVDMQIGGGREGSGSNFYSNSRLVGVNTTTATVTYNYLVTTSTAAETGSSGRSLYWNSAGYRMPSSFGGTNFIGWSFKRAPGFFDQVCYSGDDNGNGHSYYHNLGVVPELIIVKCINAAGLNWYVYAKPLNLTSNKLLYLNRTDAPITDSSFTTYSSTALASQTSTTFGVRDAINNYNRYVAYLFASCPGVSKVGSYTGTGTTNQINCGFTNGARFVMIKRTDSTGDWYVWDTARGIVSGNDPYLLMNSIAAENTSTDYVDPYSAGFEISSTAPAAINANGGSYIYLAIA